MNKHFENLFKNRKPLKRGVKLIITYTLIIALAALVVSLVIVFLVKKKDAYVAPPPAVEIIRPEVRNVKQSIKISGYIEALDMIPVVPFVSGTIKAYPIKAGMKINKGDLIAKIDDGPYKQQFLQAEAGYLGVKSSFERIQSLYKAGSTTQQNYDSVKAQHDAVKAQYDLAALQLSYTNVTAPSSGTILMAPMAVGSIGSTTQPLAIIADLTKLVVRLNVPEKYFDLFSQDKTNLYAVIRRPGLEDFSDDAVCEAELDTISPYIQAESKTFQVVFSLKDNLESFMPGMYIEVIVTYDSKDGILSLPLKVLKTDGSCYMYDAETGTVQWKDINSQIRDDKYFAINEKDDNDYSNSYFLISGQDSVFDGQQVTVLNPEKTTEKEINELEKSAEESKDEILGNKVLSEETTITSPEETEREISGSNATSNEAGAL